MGRPKGNDFPPGPQVPGWQWEGILPELTRRAVKYIEDSARKPAPFFLYLPMGALLAAWPCRRRGLLAGPAPAVVLALVLEAMQLVVRDRQPDITDFLVAGSGAIIGWAIIRRAGYPVQGETFPASAR